MKFVSTVIMFFVLAAAALSQTPVSSIPRPFAYGGLDLGDGPAYTVGAGLMENSKHFLFTGSASYDNDGKSNDNVNITRNGHNRRFNGSAYYSTSNGWFFGGGARWSKEYTAAYTKEQWHPTVGFGTDYIDPFFSARMQMDYVLPFGAEHVSASGCTVPKGQCTNNLQGPTFTVYMPSPRTKGHIFAQFILGTWWGNQTVTSTDPVLTAIQKGNVVVVSEFQITMLYRF